MHPTILWSRYSASINSIEKEFPISIYDDLLNLDFNALRTLRLVYRLGSFSKAADAIEIKQSTVSYTIDRLRQALNDPLIVRQGATNVPTERCREIIPIIDRILAEAESLQDDENFDPSKSKAHITIICATYSLRTLMPQVLKRLREAAPSIKVTLLERYNGVPELLQEGKADIALIVTNIETSGVYSKTGLTMDRAVCVMAHDNPLAGKTLTRKEFESAQQISTRLWANWVPPYETVAESLGMKINRVMTVTNPSHLAALIEGTDLIGVMPSRLARSYVDKLSIANLPFDVPVSLHLHWPAAANRSKLNIWIREIILEEASKIQAAGNT